MEKTIFTLSVELNPDLELDFAVLEDMMGTEEAFDYLEEKVREAIKEKAKEFTQEEKTPLSEWIKKAEAIQADQRYTRHGQDVKLGYLLTEMENEYDIPCLRDPEWEKQNPDILKVYRQIGDMREL